LLTRASLAHEGIERERERGRQNRQTEAEREEREREREKQDLFLGQITHSGYDFAAV
jgi:hypothetical protein